MKKKISNDYDRNTALTELELELLWKLGDISILSSLGELTAGSSDPWPLASLGHHYFTLIIPKDVEMFQKYTTEE